MGLRKASPDFSFCSPLTPLVAGPREPRGKQVYPAQSGTAHLSRSERDRAQSCCSPLTAHCSPSFTLVELMVVVAIIAMLAGLLSMTIRTARERARTTHCRNNLRQFGIAIGKYASDWDGYFIHPGGGAGAIAGGGADGIDAGGGNIYGSVGGGSDSMSPVDLSVKYEAGMYGTYGAQAGYLSRDTYHNFINNYVRSSTSEKDVTFCPEVDMDIFKTNSSSFKGLMFDAYYQYQKDTVGEITTYTFNGYAVYNLRSELKDCMFAFIDWNAAQGWLSWPSPNYYTGIKTNAALWWMEQDTVGSAVSDLYQDAGVGGAHPAKTGYGYQTEFGYHHRQRTNLVANYVAVDGHVDSIRSNASPAEFYRLFTGNELP